MNRTIRVLKMALNHKKILFYGYACMFGATVAYMLLPKMFGIAIDWTVKALEGGSVEINTLALICGSIILLSALRGLLAFGQTYFGEALGQVTVYDLRKLFYTHVQSRSFSFFDKQHTGNLMSIAITDVEAIRMFINSGLVRTPYFLILFVAVPIMLMSIDLLLGIISICFLPVLGFISARIRLRLRTIWLQVQKDMADSNTILQENLSGMKVVKAFGSEKHEEMKFQHYNAKVASGTFTALKFKSINMAIINISYFTLIAIILLFGGYRVIGGSLTAGELAQFLFYFQILNLPIRSVGMMVNNFARASAAAERIFNIIETGQHVKEHPLAIDVPRVKGDVSFKEVSFRYQESTQDALKNISVEIKSGETIALVGPPGSGKTTLVNLLSRFYDVATGSIEIDGIAINKVKLNSLRKNIGLVQQDVFLFKGSIKDNIAYGKIDAGIEEVIEASKSAQFHDFVMSLPEGYETIVGERGATLSGGQRQRLSIARALLLDPPILILDDSTSSVDAKTEEDIRRALKSVTENRTTFVIAHRLSTVHQADKIFVMDSGEIIEIGKHKDLISRNGMYKDIYNLQLKPANMKMSEIDLSDKQTVSA